MSMQKWNDVFSKEEEKKIKRSMEKQKANREYKDVPDGTYMVRVHKIEINETSWGADQLSIWFKVIDGEYKTRFIYPPLGCVLNEERNRPGNETGKNGKRVWVSEYDYMADVISALLDDEIPAWRIVGLLNDTANDDKRQRLEEFVADLGEEFNVGESDNKAKAFDLEFSSEESTSKGKTYTNYFYDIVGLYD